jgi:hypothetical protein
MVGVPFGKEFGLGYETSGFDCLVNVLEGTCGFRARIRLDSV